ncbi:ROK family protein [Flammeovirga kamogawensis]|uniref:ROK family protein n=1 Tax=Flammeovirga kamogawensis TaxID=373891 RepID=A0ABX8H307_9BACT|nr:ROK family protein [Flammeovirga kamogawensis]MBB6462418.1 putative NBD/HSP70 family sugar kinase [Flammeovirga kamogawensis]QWG09530.1 ROK family protein [Flammeovirga kamogawensis]TRX65046.1 ROK family protein [Flammeovirga kamogawensis]
MKKDGKVFKKKQIRKSQILQLLLKEKTLSPSEIATRTELTLPMSSSLMKELADDNYIFLQEHRTEKNVGRPPTSYQINPDGGYFIGVKVGLRKTRIILLDLQNKERFFVSEDTREIKDSVNFLKRLIKSIKKIINDQEIPLERVLGVGVAVPGLVNSKTGRSFSYFNDLDTTLQNYLIDALKVPVEIENDVNALTLGELHFGTAKTSENALCINLDKGIGMGMIVSGGLYTGQNGLAGELGHIRIDDHGDMCYCGKKGCLETFASGEALVKKMQEIYKKGESPLVEKILKDAGKNEVDLDVFVDVVTMGDQVGIELTEQAGVSIGKAIGILVNLFNPDKIILGGKVSQLKDYILFPVKSSVIKHSLPETFAQTTITYSDIRRKAGCLGATTLVSDKVFRPSEAAIHFV